MKGLSGVEGGWRAPQGAVKGRPRPDETEGSPEPCAHPALLSDREPPGPAWVASVVSPPSDRLKRLIAASALLLAAPVLAQSGPVAPGGRRAEVRRAAAKPGVASYYAASLHGRRTASGERYNRTALTAAHRSLPFGTLLRVKAPRTGRAVLVRVNDRGPFVRGRALDLSGAAADRLRMRSRGTLRVTYEVVDPAALPSRQAPPPRKVRHF